MAVMEGDGWTLRAARGSTTTSEEPACAPERSPSYFSPPEPALRSGPLFRYVRPTLRLAAMNRSSRNFVSAARAPLAAFLVSCLLLARPAGAEAQDRVPVITVEELADDLWVIRDGLGSGNVLLYDVVGGAYLVDAGSPASAAAIIATVDSLRVTGPSLIGSGQPDGGTIAAIQKPPPAHSRTDLAVLIPAANVLHAGDLIEVGAYPFVDWWAGGSLRGMIEEVDHILSWAQGDQRIVPGHGPVIGAAELADYLEMLVTVRDRAEAAIRRGDSEEEFLDSRPTREFDAGRGGEASGRRFASLVWYGVSRGD